MWGKKAKSRKCLILKRKFHPQLIPSNPTILKAFQKTFRQKWSLKNNKQKRKIRGSRKANKEKRTEAKQKKKVETWLHAVSLLNPKTLNFDFCTSLNFGSWYFASETEDWPANAFWLVFALDSQAALKTCFLAKFPGANWLIRLSQIMATCFICS